MADDKHGKPKRRFIRHTACFDPIENAALITKVNAAGISISAFLRFSALDFSSTRAVRSPTVNQKLASQLIAAMGEATTAFRDAAHLVDPDLAETTMHSINEYRIVLFQSMGRAP